MITGGVAGDERGAISVSMIHDEPGSQAQARGLSKQAASLQHSGASQIAAADDAPTPASSESQAPAEPSVAGARQAMMDAQALTDGPEKPAPDAQPTPWAQASFLAAHDEHASSLWQDVQPCWKAAVHTPAFKMRVILDAQGDLVRADILRDHSVAGLSVDEAAVSQALDALQACAPYTRFAGVERVYDIIIPS